MLLNVLGVAAEKGHEQPAVAGVLIAQQPKQAAAFEDFGHLAAAPFFGDQPPAAFATELQKPLVEVRIVEVAGDGVHRKAERPEGDVADLPVAEVPAENQHRPAAAQRPHGRVAVAEDEDVGHRIAADFPRQLHDLDDHAEQMPPHADDQSLDLGFRTFGKRQPQVFPRDVSPHRLLRQHAGKQEGQPVGQPRGRADRQRRDDGGDRAER